MPAACLSRFWDKKTRASEKEIGQAKNRIKKKTDNNCYKLRLRAIKRPRELIRMYLIACAALGVRMIPLNRCFNLRGLTNPQR